MDPSADPSNSFLGSLDRRSSFLEYVISTCPEGIIANDTRGNIFLYNKSAEGIFGYTAEEVIGKLHAKRLYPPGGAKEVRDYIYSPEYGPLGHLVDFETEILRKSGKKAPIRLSCSVLRENGKEIGFIGFFTDISARKALDEELRLQSITDTLTELYNRRHFHSLAQNEAVRAQRNRVPFSVLLMDVDRFKQYNDAFGHNEGDKVLRALGDAIRKNFRTMDTGFRHGGEEFLVLLPETSAENALIPAERLRIRFSEIPFLPHPEEDPRTVTLSIGIAQFHPKVSIDDLVRSADRAMYAAKNAGRNRTVTFDHLVAASDA